MASYYSCLVAVYKELFPLFFLLKVDWLDSFSTWWWENTQTFTRDERAENVMIRERKMGKRSSFVTFVWERDFCFVPPPRITRKYVSRNERRVCVITNGLGVRKNNNKKKRRDDSWAAWFWTILLFFFFFSFFCGPTTLYHCVSNPLCWIMHERTSQPIKDSSGSNFLTRLFSVYQNLLLVVYKRNTRRGTQESIKRRG